MLQEAQRALAAGDIPAALAPLSTHRQRYPRGALVEERLSLSVRAYVRAGQRDAAERAAAELRRRFPGSIHGPAIDAVLAQ